MAINLTKETSLCCSFCPREIALLDCSFVTFDGRDFFKRFRLFFLDIWLAFIGDAVCLLVRSYCKSWSRILNFSSTLIKRLNHQGEFLLTEGCTGKYSLNDWGLQKMYILQKPLAVNFPTGNKHSIHKESVASLIGLYKNNGAVYLPLIWPLYPNQIAIHTMAQYVAVCWFHE